MAVGEDVGLDQDRFTGGALGGKPAAVDLRPHALDHHPPAPAPRNLHPTMVAKLGPGLEGGDGQRSVRWVVD